MSEDLVLRLARRLDSTDPRATVSALRATSTFQGDLNWLAKLFGAADTLQLPPVPGDLAQRLDSIFVAPDSVGTEANRATGPAITVSTAIQIHDSRSDGDLVGVRDSGAPTGDGWTLIFSAPTADLLIDGTPIAGERTLLAGQVLHRSGDPGPYTVQGNGLDEAVVVDDFGCFELGAFAAGRYDLAVQSDRLVIGWTIEI